jgi:hypothetical protein
MFLKFRGVFTNNEHSLFAPPNLYPTYFEMSKNWKNSCEIKSIYCQNDIEISWSFSLKVTKKWAQFVCTF